MTKFKIGDTIIITSGNYGFTKVGSIGIITSIRDQYIICKWEVLTGDQEHNLDSNPNFGREWFIDIKHVKLLKDNPETTDIKLSRIISKIKSMENKFKERKSRHESKDSTLQNGITISEAPCSSAISTPYTGDICGV